MGDPLGTGQFLEQVGASATDSVGPRLSTDSDEWQWILMLATIFFISSSLLTFQP